MAGKDKLTRGTVITVNSQDLSDDLVPGSLNGLGFSAGEVAIFGEGEAHENYLADRKTNTLTFRLYANNTATTGSSTVIQPLVGTTTTIQVDIGSGGAAPTTGDMRFSGTFVVLGAAMTNEGGVWAHDVTARPGSSTIPAWATI